MIVPAPAGRCGCGHWEAHYRIWVIDGTWHARGGISSADMTSLTWLRMHYEEHYQIDYIQPAGQASFWQAVSRDDPPGTLAAEPAMSLRDMMRGDQSRRRRGTSS